MSVVLVRIDDRLVHGQVVEGWLKAIHATHIVVASDAVAADDTQKALYMLAVPFGTRVSCLTLQETAKAWNSEAWKPDRVLILVSSPKDVVELLDAGATMTSLNIGGIHYKQGRVQVLKAVSLDNQDISALKTLGERGIVLEARPLPLDEPVALKPILDRWQSNSYREQPR